MGDSCKLMLLMRQVEGATVSNIRVPISWSPLRYPMAGAQQGSARSFSRSDDGDAASSSNSAPSVAAESTAQDGTSGSLVWENPALMYMTGACLWSWLWWAAVSRLPESGSRPHPVATIAVGIAGLGPSIVGVMCTMLAEGEHGVARVLSTQLFARHNVAAWVVPLVPVLVAVVAAICFPHVPADLGGGGAGVSYVAITRAAGTVVRFVNAPGVARAIASHAVGAGIAQTWGWAGFMLPHLLRDGAPPLRAAALLGFMIALWRTPYLWMHYGAHTGGTLASAALTVLVALSSVPEALLLSAVYLQTNGSLLVAAGVFAGIEVSNALIDAKLVGASVEPADRVAFAAWKLIVTNALLAMPSAVSLWRVGIARAARDRRRAQLHSKAE